MTWLWRHSQQRQQVSNVIAFYDAKLCFGCVLKRSLSAYLMQVKLLWLTFYFNGGLHAVYIGKPSERMSNFLDGSVFKNRIRTKIRFSAHPYVRVCWCAAIALKLMRNYPQLACDSLLQSMCVVLVFDMHKSSRSRNLDIIFVLTLIPIYFNNKLSWCWQTCAMRLGSVEVTKHSTIPYVRYSVLLYSSNFVFKMRHFLIVVFKICDLKIRVRGHWW